MVITQAEFQANLPKYLRMASKEDIRISSQDNPAGIRITADRKERLEAAKRIFGKTNKGITLERLREERLGDV